MNKLKLPQMPQIPKMPKQPDRREYTIMLVPHHGQNVRTIRLPIRWMKGLAAVLCLAAVITAGMMLHYHREVELTKVDTQELQNLRAVNGIQSQKIQELAKATAALQADMQRLNSLDSDLRRMVGADELSGTSRGGNQRISSGEGSVNDGMGGPASGPQQLDALLATVNHMRDSIQPREQSLNDLRERIIGRQEQVSHTPSLWPANGEVTSRFGWRSSPWGGGGGDYHPGIDIAGGYGTPICATADGVVENAGWNSGGYGNLVTIDHGNGIETLYGHTSQVAVHPGETVSKGQIVAYMGSTGASTGTHVHYEVRVNGTAVNPDTFLK